MSRVIGIDLGTTFCRVAFFNWKTGQVSTIEQLESDNVLTPSYVAYTADPQPLVGDVAVNECAKNAVNTVYDAKRFIGRRFDDPVVQSYMKDWEFEVVNDQAMPKVRVTHANQQRLLAAEDISAEILSTLKVNALQKMEGGEIDGVVLTVPAHFSLSQRRATMKAAEKAELKISQMCSEPAMAALSFDSFAKLNNTPTLSQGREGANVLVFDFGGGTLDIAILKIQSAGEYHVIATGGDMNLGGVDITMAMVEYCYKKLAEDYNLQRDSLAARHRLQLRQKCDKAKVLFSSEKRSKVVVQLDFKDNDYDIVFSNTVFENEIVQPFLPRVLRAIDDTLASARLNKSHIFKVLLVGGTSKLPKVRDVVQQFFGVSTSVVISPKPQEDVVLGAAIMAAVLHNGMHPNLNGLRLFEIVPHSLGVEGRYGTMHTVIERGTLIPCTGKLGMHVIKGQRIVAIGIFEGEDGMVGNNRYLAELEIKVRQRGIDFDVCFDVLASGVFEVTAKSRLNGNVVGTVCINDFANRFQNTDIDEAKAVSDAC